MILFYTMIFRENSVPKMNTKLSVQETSLYFFLWISASFYSLYSLYNVQTDILKKDPDIVFKFKELHPGWTSISRLKDYSDFEWSTWKYFFFSSWQYLALNFIISECIRKYCKSLLQYWYIIVSIVFVSRLFGAKQLLAVVSQPVIFAAITFAGGNKSAIWVTCVLILLLVNTLKYQNTFWNFFDHDNLRDEEIYLLSIGLSWIELRCVSFCINYIDKRNKKDVQLDVFDNAITMFSYVLYLPTLYAGPIILYEDFEKSFVKLNEDFVPRIKTFIIDLLIYLLYTILLDLAFHYIYFLAMQDDIEVIRKFPSMALCGGGLWMGLQFHTKYVISYGTIAAFSRLDHIEPPPTPRCIARIHVYSHMWRYFDVGLYKFLIKYIYKPTITLISAKTNLSNLCLKQVGSLLTFMFIFIWHGTTKSIFVWSVLNYIGISLEQLGSLIVRTDSYKKFRSNVLKNERVEERFKALLCAPLFAMSAISSFYLFAGYDIGSLFFEYSFQPSFFNSIIILVALYSCCHVSVALQDVPSRKGVKCL